MDHLKIEDYENNVTLSFEHNDWFSVKSNDGQTTRILYKKPSNTTTQIDESESFSSSGSSISISGTSSPSASAHSKHKTSTSTRTSSKKTSVSKEASSRSQSPPASKEEPVIFKKDESPIGFRLVESPRSQRSSAKPSAKSSAKSSHRSTSSSSSMSTTSSSTSLSSTSSSSSYTTRGSYSGSIKKPQDQEAEDAEEEEEEEQELEKKKSIEAHDYEEEKDEKASSRHSKTQLSQTDSINQNKSFQMSMRSITSAKHSTSSSVREAEAEITEITSRKFNLSPSPRSSPRASAADFNAQAIGGSRTKINKMNLFEAVEMNQIDVLKDLIQKSPLDINKIDSSGKTLMIIACEKGYEQIVKYLADNNDSLIRIDTPLGLF